MNDFPEGQLLFSTDDAKEYLEIFMRDHFKDTTFSKYIYNNLAGDFAAELATAIMRTREL